MLFDRIAPYYNWMESLLAGGLMQRCRTAFIPQTLECRRALLAGEGTGRFLETLSPRQPHIHITCVETSAKIIEQARRRLSRRSLDLSRVNSSERESIGLQVARPRLRSHRHQLLSRLFSTPRRGEAPQALDGRMFVRQAKASGFWPIFAFPMPAGVVGGQPCS